MATGYETDPSLRWQGSATKCWHTERVLIPLAARIFASKLRLLAMLSLLSLAALACSSDDPEPRLTPSTPEILNETSVDAEESSVAKQAGGPSVARNAGEPGVSEAPLIHVLGSIRSIADPTVSFGVDASPVVGDLATVASIGCAPTSCPASAVAAWADGEVEILNVATTLAASEGSGPLGAYVSEISLQGVTTIGYGETVNEAVSPVIFSNGGQEIAIHAISLGENTSAATESSPGVAGASAIDLLRESIISNRDDGRGVVVLIDWGALEARAPTAEQVADVEQIVNAGADAIIGHGSDFLQRFDLVGQSAVAYSLGNASITTPDPLRADTAIMRLEFDTPGRSCLLPATAGPSGPSLDNAEQTVCG